MAATYIPVTIEEMDRFLKRAYRALRPKTGESRGEVYYDLNLSDEKIFIRVWTSIRPRSGVGAGVGTDAIRVTMVTQGGKPLTPKGKIVKRTQNWRGNLQDRIEGLLEDYESKTGYWKGRQVERDRSVEQEASKPNTEPQPDPTPPDNEGEIEGQFTKSRDGEWMAKIFSEGFEGADALLVRKSGRGLRVKLVRRYWKGRDRFSGKYAEMWSFEAPGQNRYASNAEIAVALIAEEV